MNKEIYDKFITNIIDFIIKDENIFKAVAEKYNNSSNRYNEYNNFEEYLTNNYVYYKNNQDVNDYHFNKYQTYREVMEHYNILLKEKLDKNSLEELDKENI